MPNQYPDRKSVPASKYTVRVSHRAKHVRLKISPANGLEVVVPRGFDTSTIPAILSSKQDWIERSLRRAKEQLKVRRAISPGERPESVELRALGETWRVRYQTDRSHSDVVLSEVQRSVLSIEGGRCSAKTCNALLCQWLQYKARQTLVPWLQETSRELNLPYGNTLVRGQRTRWGSCSSRKTISLNYKLLFLPEILVRYLFVHELCHTQHLNHSQRFWNLVATKEPDYRRLEATLNEAWRYIPLWVEQ